VPNARIIAGRWRSRHLEVPPPDRTRPMPDRVKGAIFDILGSRLGTPGGAVPSICVADLFAGSGSMGLEAVSRGARRCVFVERDRIVLGVLRRNLDRLQAEPGLRVVCGNAWTRPLDKLAEPGETWGLVFVDPPYRDSRDTGPTGKVARLLARLSGADCVDCDTVVVLHHERRIRFEPQPGDPWVLTDRRDYGTNAISFLGLVPAAAQPAAADDQIVPPPSGR